MRQGYLEAARLRGGGARGSGQMPSGTVVHRAPDTSPGAWRPAGHFQNLSPSETWHFPTAGQAAVFAGLRGTSLCGSEAGPGLG